MEALKDLPKRLPPTLLYHNLRYKSRSWNKVVLTIINLGKVRATNLQIEE